MNALRRLLRRGLAAADDFCASFGADEPSGAGSLVTVYFHAVLRHPAEARGHALAPHQEIAADVLHRFLEGMLQRGYVPVTPTDIDLGLPPGRRHLFVTFDDGYFNNIAALPVLERLGLPATFFVSSSHVLEGRAFWWDALARGMRGHGAGERQVQAEIRRMKIWPVDRIEASLRARFGAGALRPQGDLDRPFEPGELRDFARHRLVSLGNHTRDHAILPNCSPAEMARQIGGCQQALREIAGEAPIAIAYPHGGYSRAAVEAARGAGLRVGLTTRPCAAALPLDDEKGRMTLGRFLVTGGDDPLAQGRRIVAPFVPGHLLKTLFQSAY